MSVPATLDVAETIERCRPAKGTPVHLEAADLESTATAYLRALKRALRQNGLFPAGLTVHASFDEDCSLDTQVEIDRIRDHLRAGAFLGVSSVTVVVEEVANPEKVRPSLAACRERAERDGLALELDAPITLDRR